MVFGGRLVVLKVRGFWFVLVVLMMSWNGWLMMVILFLIGMICGGWFGVFMVMMKDWVLDSVVLVLFLLLLLVVVRKIV